MTEGLPRPVSLDRVKEFLARPKMLPWAGPEWLIYGELPALVAEVEALRAENKDLRLDGSASDNIIDDLTEVIKENDAEHEADLAAARAALDGICRELGSDTERSVWSKNALEIAKAGYSRLGPIREEKP